MEKLRNEVTFHGVFVFISEKYEFVIVHKKGRLPVASIQYIPAL
ncbi:hypothetical protein [Peribacillus tepidiphilus]